MCVRFCEFARESDGNGGRSGYDGYSTGNVSVCMGSRLVTVAYTNITTTIAKPSHRPSFRDRAIVALLQ
jgi:hypothetical protein